jgi:hypothetical protein
MDEPFQASRAKWVARHIARTDAASVTVRLPTVTEHRKRFAAQNAAQKSISQIVRGMLSDPNGTRTRVAGVKGRCPRPLDDGAARAANSVVAAGTTSV